MIRSLFFGFVFTLFASSVTVQEVAQKSELQKQLDHERLVRIVEPVIYPLQLMAKTKSDWENFDRVCGEHETEMGRASVFCKVTPEPYFLIEGPNPSDRLWGDKTTEVTIYGYQTHEHLWLVNGPDSPTRKCCEQKNGTLLTVEPVVVARLTVVTKFWRWDEKETAAANQIRREFLGNDSKRLEVGDVRGHITEVSPVVYEFLNEKP